MKAARSMLGIARADFLERTRRYSFFLAVLFATFLGYAAARGKIFLQFDGYRGVYTSGWVGALVGLVITCFVSLAGFYVVKNSVERDRLTGVGQIVAATPVSKVTYAFGKFLSNVAVLSAMVAVLAAAAVAMQFLVAEDRAMHLWALLSPFLLLALPTMALTAAVALGFEMLPGLRGGFGNVVWFFAWVFALTAPVISKRSWLDPVGIVTVMNSLGAEAHRYVPDYHGGMSLSIEVGRQVQVVEAWRWAGISWSAQLVGLRLMWFAVACALVGVAALVFDRFDTSRVRRFRVMPATGLVRQEVALESAGSTQARVHLSSLEGRAHGTAFGRMFLAELRLALFGQRWWWYVVAGAFLIAQLAAPLEASRGPILASSWMWCVLVWSSMGVRETRFTVRQVLFSCANVVPGQVAACFTAGVLVAAMAGAGALVRLLLAHSGAGLLAWVAGALLLPAAALFLGVLSGTSKPFEALLTVAWYVGPMNHTPVLDFTGSVNGNRTLVDAVVYVVLAAALLAAALAMRARQLRSL